MLEVGADKLFAVYGKAFAHQVRTISNEFCPSFRSHIDKGGMAQEPQNKPEYLGEEGDTGVRETNLEFDKLKRLVD